MFRLLLLGLSCLVLVSCIDGDEEVWIEKDGSGRIEATYRMPPQFMNDLGGAEQMAGHIREAVENDPDMTLEALEHHFESGQVVLSFAAGFDDFRKLSDFGERYLRDPAAPGTTTTEERLLGDIDIRIEGLTLIYDRKVDLSPIFPERVRANPGLLGASAFNYTLHMPVAATEHDAHETTNEGRTLKWTFPLRNYTGRAMSTSAKAVLPVPWWIWTVGILSLVVLAVLAVWAVRYRAATRQRG